MSKVILTDCDEVLFDWSTPFEAWVREHYPEHRNALGELRDHWHVEAWLGCTIEESREMIRIFNSDPEIWPYFKPIPGTTDIIKKLHDEHGYKFVAITACATDKQTYDGRWQNLQAHYGDAFDTLHCVGLSETKAGHLARYRPTYWVEDKMKHATAGADLGHKSFLINYQHNVQYNDDRVTRVDDWYDIYDHLLEYEEVRLVQG